MNRKLNVAEQLRVAPWQAFVAALKAQFEPLLWDEWARKEIWKLSQIGNVNNYIYCLRELKNEEPSMKSAEAYSLFMYGINP